MNDDGAGTRDETPGIDLSPALGEAGHEVEDLGYEGIPDTGPVLGQPERRDRATEADDALDIAATEFPSD